MSAHSHRPGSAGHPQTRDRAAALGNVIRAQRRELRLTQERLGERVGVDRQSILRWENAAYSPSLHQLFKLADGLQMPLSELIAAAEKADAERRRGAA